MLLGNRQGSKSIHNRVLSTRGGGGGRAFRALQLDTVTCTSVVIVRSLDNYFL